MLEIKNLTIYKKEKDQEKNKENIQRESIVQNVNFPIDVGKTTVVLGESGSGKTLTALSVMGLLPENLSFSNDSIIQFEGQNLLILSEYEFRKIRGKKIGMIFQDPQTSLNPVMNIHSQIEEGIKIHKRLKGKDLRGETLRLLEIVQMPNPKAIGKLYPHQLSGGMKQRAMIAMALAGQPKLLIADEPTTALDVTIQAEIISLLKKLQQEFNMSLLFITHDLSLAAEIAQSIVIMKDGKVVEFGTVDDIIHSPQHLYTKQLMHTFSKHQPHSIPRESETLLSVTHLNVAFPIKKGIFRRTVGYFHAVQDVSFTLKKGETLAIVGESGSGKTTIGKSILRLLREAEGDIIFNHLPISKMSETALRRHRRDFQMIVQDPFAAMDPRMRVAEILKEGLLAQKIIRNELSGDDKIDKALIEVGLKPEHKYRYPHQFSGGQRQRICIARALLLNPKLMICDEPTSSLDVTIQAQIVDLLIKLQQEFNLSYLFITHNIRLVQMIAHTVAVMQAGRIVEYGPIDFVLREPKHPFTQKLIKISNITL